MTLPGTFGGMPRPVGAHVGVGGGLLRAIERAEQRSCDALQIFPSNPRGWAVPKVDNEEEARARALLNERSWPLYLHAPYLVNLASPDDAVWKRSAENLAFALARGERLGATAVIVHAGHSVGAERGRAMERVVAALRVLLDRYPAVEVAIEPTAGATGSIAGNVEQMAELLDALERHPRLRFCPDTCHLWAAGADYSDDGVFRSLRTELAAIGPDRFVAVHLNDSHDACGTRRDRHANLGRGEIPLEAIRRLVTCPELRTAPLIVETPGGAEEQGADVALARSWG